MIASMTRAGGGKTAVIIRCDDCRDPLQDLQLIVPGGNNPGGSAGRSAASIAPGADLPAKITAHGWRQVGKKKHTCPACITAKRTITKPKEEEMAISQQEGLRQPTRDQKREIMAMLQDVYDPAAQRYRGAETDKTIAETLGDGILFGWVAQLREEFFGPDGNEAADLLISEVQEWMKKADALSAKLHDSHAAWTKDMREFNDAKAKVADLADRLAKASRTRVISPVVAAK